MTVLVFGALPVVILYALLKRRYNPKTGFFIAGISVYIPLSLFMIVTIDNPPYLFLIVIPVSLIIYFLVSIKLGSDITSFGAFLAHAMGIIGLNIIEDNHTIFLYPCSHTRFNLYIRSFKKEG
ncbi:hypothetical protein [Bacillus horti]|uniref:Asparagine N-glycosylation enzyme membrane subunit Stt3 n=1 Tax=Caldalkalibacillus horti TaxID=77523 RepID=A0ABT9W253_9BACI|nr:hypothetical protein [Bacillus horti]MDQ0167195.1 asparagine N-glycosylation enzyme membrane subunit Stt3 [Bacillus horti]